MHLQQSAETLDARERVPRGSRQEDASETRQEADGGHGDLAVPGMLPRQFGVLREHVWQQLHQTLQHGGTLIALIARMGFISGYRRCRFSAAAG